MAHFLQHFLGCVPYFLHVPEGVTEYLPQLAAMLFSLFQTLALWGLNPRAWLSAYLQTCAAAGGQAPRDLATFLPWSMDAARRAELSRPAARVSSAEPPAGLDSS